MPVHSDFQIVEARRIGRALSRELGFPPVEQTLIVAAISELTRNILAHAGYGEVTLRHVEGVQGRGIVVVARDKGPGIPDNSRLRPDVESAPRFGSPPSTGLRLELSDVGRLMDEFQILAEVGQGTTVTVKKWVR